MKKMIMVIFCIIICLNICACAAPEADDIEGRWDSSESTYSGYDTVYSYCFSPEGGFYCGIRFADSNTLVSSSVRYGKWEISGNEILLTYNEGGKLTLTYSGGKLVDSSGEKYTKVGGYYD